MPLGCGLALWTVDRASGADAALFCGMQPTTAMAAAALTTVRIVRDPDSLAMAAAFLWGSSQDYGTVTAPTIHPSCLN